MYGHRRVRVNAWVRCCHGNAQSDLDRNRQTRQARKRIVIRILSQRENPSIEISAILTQSDRALSVVRQQGCQEY